MEFSICFVIAFSFEEQVLDQDREMKLADEISVYVNYGLILLFAIFIILVTEFTFNRSRILHKHSLTHIQLRYKKFLEDYNQLKKSLKTSKRVDQV